MGLLGLDWAVSPSLLLGVTHAVAGRWWLGLDVWLCGSESVQPLSPVRQPDTEMLSSRGREQMLSESF